MLSLKNIKKALRLYAVTDSDCLVNTTLAAAVEQALCAGVTFLQLREKNMPYEDFLAEARELAIIAKQQNVPFVINDDVEIAIECDADGIHVGQSDIKGINIREIIGADKILGISVDTPEEAILAQENGADYLGVGAVFPTSTKTDASTISYEQLCKICSSVSIPVVAIGGICEDNIQKLAGSGIAGVAVISAIFAKEDIKSATKDLLLLTKKIIED